MRIVGYDIRQRAVEINALRHLQVEPVFVVIEPRKVLVVDLPSVE